VFKIQYMSYVDQHCVLQYANSIWCLAALMNYLLIGENQRIKALSAPQGNCLI